MKQSRDASHEVGIDLPIGIENAPWCKQFCYLGGVWVYHQKGIGQSLEFVKKPIKLHNVISNKCLGHLRSSPVLLQESKPLEEY